MKWLLLILYYLPFALSLAPYRYFYKDESNGVSLYWNLTSTRLYMAIRAKTTGWVGVGFGETKSMVNSDIIMGWISSSGGKRLYNYYATSNAKPTSYNPENTVLVDGEEADSETTLEFYRTWTKGKNPDYGRDIDPFKTTNLLWAYSTSDGLAFDEFGKHQKAGAISLILCYTCSVPSKPSPPRSVSANITSIRVQWSTPTSDGNTTISRYILERDDGSGNGNFIQACATTLTLNCDVTGLLSGLSYQFRLAAVNGMGQSAFSDIATLDTLSFVTSKPDPVRFVAATTTTLTVAWNPPAQNGGSAVTEYHLFQGSSMIFSGLDLKYEVKSLSAGTSYTFTVVARNKVGDSPPSDPSVLHTDATQVTAPSAITEFSVKSVTIDSVFMNWTDPGDGGSMITGYTLSIESTNNEKQSLNINKTNYALSHTFYNLTRLQPSTRYLFRMAAINRMGPGTFSTQINAMTSDPPNFPPKPENLKIVTVLDQQVKLKWPAVVPPSGDLPILGYLLVRRDIEFGRLVNESAIIVYNGTALTFSDATVIPDRSYSYNLLAYNARGNSTSSEFLQATTLQVLSSDSLSSSNYKNVVDLDSSLKLAWTVHNRFSENPIVEFAMELQGTGWMGIGVSPEGTMKDADIIMGSIRNDAFRVLDYFSLNSGSPVLDTSDPTGTNDVLASIGFEKDGVTTIKFRRSMEPTDTATGLDRAISKNDDMTQFIYAYHPTAVGLTKHPEGSYGKFKVNILAFEDNIKLDKDVATWKIIHGSFMTLSWLIILPTGIFIARHFKHIGHTWYTKHMFLQVFGIVLTLAAFIIVIVQKAPKGDLFSAEASTALKAHGYIGLAIVFVSVAQPILGKLADVNWVADREVTPVFPDKTHWWMGRFGVLLAIANVCIGLYVVEALPHFYAIIAILVVAIMVAAVLLAFKYPLEVDDTALIPETKLPPHGSRAALNRSAFA